MGFRDTFTHWRDTAAKTTQHLILDTATYALQHLPPYMVAVSDVLDNHPLLADIWRSTSRIFVQDAIPMAVAKFANDEAQSALQEYNNPLAESLKWGIWGAASIFIIGRALEGTARTVALGAEAGSVLAGLENGNTSRYKKLCEDAHCTQLRFIKGAVRDFVAYQATERLLIPKMEFLPFVGSSTALLTSLWNSGGYACSAIMPICNRHLVENKQQNPAFVFAVGVNHYLLTYLLTYFIQNPKRLPVDAPANQSMDYQLYLILTSMLIGQLCLVAEMMLAAKIEWPDPVIKATRYAYNPLMIFQRVVGFVFDAITKHSKSLLPMLEKAATDSGAARWVETKAQQAWNHPIWADPRLHYPEVVLSWLSWLLLPQMLYHKGGLAQDSMIGPNGSFAQDPVIGRSWDKWREEIIGKIDELEEERKKYVIRGLMWAAKDTKTTPAAEQNFIETWMKKTERMAKFVVKKTAGVIAKLTGHPEFNEFGWTVLKAMDDDFILRMLRYLRDGLEGKEPLELPCAPREDLSVLDDVIKWQEAPDVSISVVHEVKEIEASSADANSQHVSEVLPLKPDSTKPRPVESRLLLGLNPNIMFSPPQSVKSVRWLAAPATEEGQSEQEALEDRLAQAKNDLYDIPRAHSSGARQVTHK